MASNKKKKNTQLSKETTKVQQTTLADEDSISSPITSPIVETDAGEDRLYDIKLEDACGKSDNEWVITELADVLSASALFNSSEIQKLCNYKGEFSAIKCITPCKMTAFVDKSIVECCDKLIDTTYPDKETRDFKIFTTNLFFALLNSIYEKVEDESYASVFKANTKFGTFLVKCYKTEYDGAHCGFVQIDTIDK